MTTAQQRTLVLCELGYDLSLQHDWRRKVVMSLVDRERFRQGQMTLSEYLSGHAALVSWLREEIEEQNDRI